MWSRNKTKIVLCLLMLCALVGDIIAQPGPGGGGPPDPPSPVPLSGTWILIIVGAIIGILKLAISRKSRA